MLLNPLAQADKGETTENLGVLESETEESCTFWSNHIPALFKSEEECSSVSLLF